MKKTNAIGKFYYFFPQSVVVVGVADNLMPAAWHMPVSAQPPLYAVSISPKRHTWKLLKKEDGFTVNFLEQKQASLIAKLGSTSGRDLDKFNANKIEFMPAETVNARILEISYAAYECKKVAFEEYGDHYLAIGTVVLIHYREGILEHRSNLVKVRTVSPILYFGMDRYITIDPATLTIQKR